jgi:hypothetical protein
MKLAIEWPAKGSEQGASLRFISFDRGSPDSPIQSSRRIFTITSTLTPHRSRPHTNPYSHTVKFKTVGASPILPYAATFPQFLTTL